MLHSNAISMFTHIVLFGKSIPTYSITAAVGIIAAIFYTKKRVKQEAFSDLDKYLELELVYSLVGAVIGAKFLYLLIEYKSFSRDLRLYGIDRTVYAYLAGGFVFYGGLIGCIVAIYFYCKKTKISVSHSLQLVLPAIPLMHFFGRLGCLLTGCCFGRETNCLIHVIYTNSQFAPNGVPLIPVQLMEALLELVIFYILYRISKNNAPGNSMLCIYFVLYGIGRFILELFRGDEYRGYVGTLSISQMISLLLILFGTSYLLYVVKTERVKS